MTKLQLKTVTNKLLQTFNKKRKIPTNEDTKLNEVLSASDSFGGRTSSQEIFKSLVIWTMTENEHANPKRKWPSDWPTWTLNKLVEFLAILLLILLPVIASSQVQVELNTVKTPNRVSALQIGIEYLQSLDSMFSNRELLAAKRNSLFAASPEFNIRTGTEDVFSSITAKMSGMWAFFKRDTLSGVVIPNIDRGLTVVPVSIGAETDNRFKSINLLGEIGWVPWYQIGSVPDWLRQTDFAVFAQVGYKFDGDSLGIGGLEDQSEEEPNSFLFRVKTSAKAQINTPVRVGLVPVTLVGGGDLWFDIANKATYYRYNANLRFVVANDRYVDLIYQKGSGAPNFNQGDQYGIGLTINF